MKRPTAILVTGMHRSGTSATAGALHHAGVALGRDLLPPGVDNPKGYFENERAVAINERLLARLGSRWDDVRELPEGWVGRDAAREALSEIDNLLESEFADDALWALKDPRLCRLMPIWLEALRTRSVDATALFVVRHPVQVAASIESRNGWAPAIGELLWLRYMFEAEAATRGLVRTAIAFDALLKDPVASLKAATTRIGIKLPERRADALVKFVDPAERHQRQRTKHPGGGPFGAIVEKVHDALTHITRGEDAWEQIEAAQADFCVEWERIGSHVNAVAEMAASFDAQANFARETAANAASELHAQMDWARIAVQKEEALRAEVARLEAGLAAQVKWAETAVGEREALQAEIAQLRSELFAQVEWSEGAVREREALQAEIATLRSELAAQVGWAESATRKHEAQLAEWHRAREALNLELAGVRSDLLAQVEWSEEAVSREEVLHAEVAQLRSDLAAQLAWSEGAVREREALQAELSGVRSELVAQLAWSEGAVHEREALQADLARVRSELVAQLAWSEVAVTERESLQAQLSQVHSELAAQIAWSESAVQQREELEACIEQLRTDLATQQRRAEVAQEEWRRRSQAHDNELSEARSRIEELERTLAEIHATLSWRLTRPLRSVSGTFSKKDKGNRQA